MKKAAKLLLFASLKLFIVGALFIKLVVLLELNRVRSDVANVIDAPDFRLIPRSRGCGSKAKGRKKIESKLEFVHITKTGGSAIEKAGAKAGISWGACHYIKRRKLNCCNPDLKRGSPTREIPGTIIGDGFCDWHVPPSFFVKNPFENRTTFTVVRNIYDRVVSEFYCPWEGYKGKGNRTDPAVMNSWIQKKLKEQMRKKPTHQRHFHFYPHHRYILDEDGKRSIQHVLHYENLHEEFSALMSLYNLHVNLPRKSVQITNHSTQRIIQRLSSQDLSSDSIRLINRYYGKDFELLNYLKWKPSCSSGSICNEKTEVQWEDKVMRGMSGVWDSAPVVIEKYRLLFFTIPKVSCTTFKMLFRRMEGHIDWKSRDRGADLHNPKKNGLKYLNDFSLKRAQEMMVSAKWTRAIFLRDPRERLLSAFLDKAVNKYYVHRICCRQFASKNVVECDEKIKSFAGFLNVIENCDDQHWEPQSNRIDEKFWKHVNFYGYMHSIAHDTKRLLNTIGNDAWKDYGENGWGSYGNESIYHGEVSWHATHAKNKVDDYYTDSLTNKVRMMFQDDYNMFNFTKK